MTSSSNNTKLLSIIVPSYNALPYLKRTLWSIADTTHIPFELIIIDDCSDGKTQSFLHEIEDTCIVIFNESQQFVTHNWNLGIKNARGEYVAVLNNDVDLVNGWDVKLINRLNNDVWVASPYMTDPTSSVPFRNDEKFKDIHLAGPCFVMERKTFDVIGLFPESMRIWGNDSWLSWVVTEKHHKQAIFVPDVVVYHHKSRSCDEFSERRREKFVDIVHQDMHAFKKIQEHDNTIVI